MKKIAIGALLLMLGALLFQMFRPASQPTAVYADAPGSLNESSQPNAKVRAAVASLAAGGLKEAEISGFPAAAGHAVSPLVIRDPALCASLLAVLRGAVKSNGEDLLDRTETLTLRDAASTQVAFRIQMANGWFDFGDGWQSFIQAVAAQEAGMLKQEVAAVAPVREVVVNGLLPIREPGTVRAILAALASGDAALFDYGAARSRRYRFDLAGDSTKTVYAVLATDAAGNPSATHWGDFAAALRAAPYEAGLEKPVDLDSLPPPGVGE